MNENLIFLVLFVAIMYFFMFMPQIKKQKKQRKFISELKKGDKVVTTGGIHGKITELKELTVILDLGGGAKMKINRAAISLEATSLDNVGEDKTE